MEHIKTGLNQTNELPERFSPSSLQSWEKCPTQFYYNYILKIKQPATLTLFKGTVVHGVLEKIFENPAQQRTPNTALSLIMPAWDELIEQENIETYVQNWFKLENPTRFEPVSTELDIKETINNIPLRGIIDRYDEVTFPSGKKQNIISDYKTGKVPSKNSPWIKQRFFAMKIYAALMLAHQNKTIDQLRLVYVGGVTRDAVISMPCDQQTVEDTQKNLKKIVDSIYRQASEGTYPTNPTKLCDWCSYKPICPAWTTDHHNTPKEQLVEIVNRNVDILR